MRLSVLLMSAVFALALTDVGFAQATLPTDEVNSANNPGSAKVAPPERVEALDCTCRSTPADAAAATKPGSNAATGDRNIDCTCHKTSPDTTGALARPEAAATGPAGEVAAPSR
ncbi:hypothetical protein [Methylobacterium persicinum]|uniref:Uncharacterized protein n=1 Tax=Methylobacterium persicinum TaxID=374426 RepID=A0ABU0HST0_9HYPH|nr:hypothetical protein [Methylobacterium persicinum]MDQ0445351.1 hypothetical protein [Methylobacterium persicinum]GJE40272.1 hypothetical protein KHHGKMAE_4363 [Methylobacterium persicinum]